MTQEQIGRSENAKTWKRKLKGALNTKGLCGTKGPETKDRRKTHRLKQYFISINKRQFSNVK